jgi:uncharacterized protein (TIGR02246 family)
MTTRASTLPAEDIRAIEQVHKKWIADELSGNARAVVDLCTDDVVWLPPGGRPLRGRQTILHWLSGPPVAVASVEITNLAIRGEGRIAYKTAEFTTTYQKPSSNLPLTDRGAHVWILEKGDDGAWRIAVATWTVLGVG